MTRSTWYLRVLNEYSRSAVRSTSAILILLLGLSIVRFMNGGSFQWISIEPIDQPDIMSRVVYSSLTFVSLGAILYYLQFYRYVSWLFGSDRSGYRGAKRIVWLGLMLAMYSYIVPFIVNILNGIVSFVYNVSLLVFYLSPLLFVTAVAALVVVVIGIRRVKLKYAYASQRPPIL